MTHFPQSELFDPERLTTNSIESLSPRAKKLYEGWLFDLKKGKTFFGLNWNWPSTFDSTIRGFYDTYVFSWHIENWDHEWLKNFCETHPDSQIVVIGEFSLDNNYYSFYRKIKNLKCLVHHCWDQLINEVLTIDDIKYVPVVDRKYKFSSLSGKPSYFKALVTAYLMLTYDLRDTLLSWNIKNAQDTCPSLGFLDVNVSSVDEIKPWIEFYHSTLKHQQIKLDSFTLSRLSAYHYNIPAYTDCLINSTNETYAQSLANRKTFPGPFITEKTWKPLLAGCGLLSQGQQGIYSYLENFGFVFDYPWDRSYDTIPGDIDRFLKYIKTIDFIFESDHNVLAQQLAESSEFNYNHIRSDKFKARIQELNQQYLSEFLRNY